jgi:hypothetical protein
MNPFDKTRIEHIWERPAVHRPKAQARPTIAIPNRATVTPPAHIHPASDWNHSTNYILVGFIWALVIWRLWCAYKKK